MRYERRMVSDVIKFFSLPKRLIQIMVGPRQVGKTTAAAQIAEKWKGPVVSVSADQPLPPSVSWLEHHWNQAVKKPGTLLIVDEIQKVRGWSDAVKCLWDKSEGKKQSLRVLLLGSSALLLQKGLNESLAGRFYLHRFPHWSFREMKDAFGFLLDQWIFWGGYPGPVAFQDDFRMWSQYVRDSLIESVIAKDVLQLQTVAKPALLRHLFMLATSYPAQILSYNKMLGQLQDAGNTTTLAHYLKLLESAFLISGLEQYHKGYSKKRGSSPKLILWNNALISAVAGMPFEKVRNDPVRWGRLVENAVGAHLLNQRDHLPCEIYYWRKDANEVDFIVETRDRQWAVEVKSGSARTREGMEFFKHVYPESAPLYVGGGGMALEDFFQTPVEELFA